MHEIQQRSNGALINMRRILPRIQLIEQTSTAISADTMSIRTTVDQLVNDVQRNQEMLNDVSLQLLTTI